MRESDTLNPSADSWQHCPNGRFERLSSNLRRQRSRRVFMKQAVTASVVAVVGVGAGLAYWFSGSREPNVAAEPNFGGVTCSEVGVYAAAGNPLPHEVRDKIRIHLADCCICRETYGARFGNLG